MVNPLNLLGKIEYSFLFRSDSFTFRISTHHKSSLMVIDMHENLQYL